MISRTRTAVAGLTPDSPLTTRETVLIDTSARRATSAMVGRPGPVLRGQVRAPVRQRWHSPSLSGAERASSTMAG